MRTGGRKGLAHCSSRRLQLCGATGHGWLGEITWTGLCIAASMASQGVHDSFRLRHPSLSVFTHFHKMRSASRIDGIWVIAVAVVVDDVGHGC